MKDYSDKKNIVIWSGGADSTCLLYEIAKEFGSKENPVYAYTFVDNDEFIVQTPKEKIVRKNLKKKFKELKLNIKYIEMKREVKGYLPMDKIYGLPQCMMWMSGIFPLILSGAYIHFGYIKEDDFWHHYHEVKEIFKLMAGLGGVKASELSIPYEWWTKKDILDSLIEYNLIDDIWYCENNESTPCGKCPSCKKHDKAMEQINKEKSEEECEEELSEIVKEIETLKEKELVKV